MYREVRASYGVEVRGLYALLTSYGEHKPADFLVHSGSVHEDQYPGKAVALDVAVTDPTTHTSINTHHSDREPLAAAKARHQQKKGTHTRAERQAARDGTGPLPFEKAPIVMETSGAFSKFTQDWFKKLVRVDKAQQAWRGNGVYSSRRLRNLDWTWSANSFGSWHSQCISVAHARMQAQAVNDLIGECLEKDYPVAPNG